MNALMNTVFEPFVCGLINAASLKEKKKKKIDGKNVDGMQMSMRSINYGPESGCLDIGDVTNSDAKQLKATADGDDTCQIDYAADFVSRIQMIH
uniref:Uncharacterized protein n=1 Tax=Syphacia muris TaxID=451379 RepID=A0A0N5AL50_9BILA